MRFWLCAGRSPIIVELGGFEVQQQPGTRDLQGNQDRVLSETLTVASRRQLVVE